ncbi:hypothetical protein [Ureibacillus acetophenoni]
MAPDYILVQQSVYHEFVALLKKTIQQFFGKILVNMMVELLTINN